MEQQFPNRRPFATRFSNASNGNSSVHGANNNNHLGLNGHFSAASSGGSNSSSPASSVSGSHHIPIVMPTTSSANNNNNPRVPMSAGAKPGGGGRAPFSLQNALQDSMNKSSELSSNVRDLKDSMSQMRGTSASLSTATVTSSASMSSQMFNRSVSAGKMGMPGAGGNLSLSGLGGQQAAVGSPGALHIQSGGGLPHHFKRHETSPAIMELPSQSPTDSLDEQSVAGSGLGPYPIVTSPVSDMAELAAAASGDLNFSDGESGTSGSLTSPNLVSSSGLGALALPGVSAVSNGSGGGGLSSASGKLGAGSTFSHHLTEARKMSTSSRTKIMQCSDGKTTSSSTETATANESQLRRVQTGDGHSYEEKSAASAMKSRLESGGIVAEKTSGMKQFPVRRAAAVPNDDPISCDSSGGRRHRLYIELRKTRASAATRKTVGPRPGAHVRAILRICPDLAPN